MSPGSHPGDTSFESMTGDIEFEENGDVNRFFKVVRVKGNSYE